MGRIDEWDLDYAPEKGNKTGLNMLKKALEKSELSWFDKDLDKRISRKALPKNLRDYAQLNPVLQSHLLAELFDLTRGLGYNKTTNQYGLQVQRYFRKLYVQ